MPKRLAIKEQLRELSLLIEQGSSPAGVTVLQKALRSPVNLLAARAAEVAGQWEEEALVEHLETAFERFLVNPVKMDPGCKAKKAIVEALYRIGAPSAAVFLRGIGHVQKEPSYGPPVDTAPAMRGLCGMGLVRMNHPSAMNELARLLADPESDARILAARAIAYANDGRGEPLLRYKIFTGDPNPQVLAECFLALLQLDADSSLSFVAAYLDSDDAGFVEAAMIAMGESRLPQALPPLREAYSHNFDKDTRQGILFAAAALRCEEAITFLLEELDRANETTAEAVLAALAGYRHDPAVREKVHTIVDQKKDRRLSQILREQFGD